MICYAEQAYCPHTSSQPSTTASGSVGTGRALAAGCTECQTMLSKGYIDSESGQRSAYGRSGGQRSSRASEGPQSSVPLPTTSAIRPSGSEDKSWSFLEPLPHRLAQLDSKSQGSDPFGSGVVIPKYQDLAQITAHPDSYMRCSNMTVTDDQITVPEADKDTEMGVSEDLAAKPIPLTLSHLTVCSKDGQTT